MGYRQECVAPSVQEFRDWLESDDPDTSDIRSVIHEIAESNIPVMTYRLLELAMEDLGLATGEPATEFSEHTAFNAIYGNIFDEVFDQCWRVWNEHRERKVSEAILIFDNRGETIDRYTVFYIGFADPDDYLTEFITMSENPDHPQGVGLRDTVHGYPDEFTEYEDGIGWQIDFHELPARVRNAVLADVESMEKDSRVQAQ